MSHPNICLTPESHCTLLLSCLEVKVILKSRSSFRGHWKGHVPRVIVYLYGDDMFKDKRV